jgi:Ca2+:H+ antiporter
LRYHRNGVGRYDAVATTEHIDPTHTTPLTGTYSWTQTARAIAFASWTNVLLVFVPAGITTGLCKLPPIVIFAFNAIAIVPLSSLLAFATERIADDLGDTIGALMNISFGNLIEVIMFVIALIHNEIHVVQGALVGSILVNLLLILGTAIIAGEFNPIDMTYDMNNAQALACLLSLSVFSILIPVGTDRISSTLVDPHRLHSSSPLTTRSCECEPL